MSSNGKLFLISAVGSVCALVVVTLSICVPKLVKIIADM